MFCHMQYCIFIIKHQVIMPIDDFQQKVQIEVDSFKKEMTLSEEQKKTINELLSYLT